jgi:hypothetical protein
MRALGVSELLSVWERAYGQRPAMRALTLVAATSVDEDIDPRVLPVGDRDARLLSLRESVFGETVESLADCAACGEKMELSFKTSDVRAPGPPPAGAPVVVGEYEVEWRLPTSGDLAELPPDEVAEETGARLLERCVVRAKRGDEPVAPTDLPGPVRDALAQAVERADPQADVELTIGCPACAHVNVVPFDVAAFFWDELNAWSFRTLQDVHELASAYGWSERDVLGMTSFRRQIYLEMLG